LLDISSSIPSPLTAARDSNRLFPVFLKLETLSLLIIGGGKVALEKLHAVLGNAPATSIRIVAIDISEELAQEAARHSNIELVQKKYDSSDLTGAEIVIVAVNDIPVATEIRNDAKQRGILVNVADKPELCDFYLGSIVKKGNLKIAISTNGKSPTIAKRLKETFNDTLPEEMDEVLDNMETIRKSMNGDFAEKVTMLNDITKVLAAKQAVLAPPEKPKERKWQQIVKWCLFAFLFMILGHALLSLVPFHRILEGVKAVPDIIGTREFMIMVLCGFIAQMSDGSLGMGYGTIATTFLLANGVNPAIVSSRVHAARVFSSGVSGYSHHRFGNINKKLFRALVIPGIMGAILGVTLAFYGQKYSSFLRIPLSLYTIYLGYYILRKAFARKNTQGKVKRAGWLAVVGGFMDSFAGGGWGTLVTSTLISKRKNARYVIGSVCLAEFFVVLTSSITFFIFLKSLPILDVAGLILGGLIAAPIAARLVGKLPLKTMYIAIGALVILTSVTTLWRAYTNLSPH